MKSTKLPTIEKQKGKKKGTEMPSRESSNIKNGFYILIKEKCVVNSMRKKAE